MLLFDQCGMFSICRSLCTANVIIWSVWYVSYLSFIVHGKCYYLINVVCFLLVAHCARQMLLFDQCGMFSTCRSLCTAKVIIWSTWFLKNPHTDHGDGGIPHPPSPGTISSRHCSAKLVNPDCIFYYSSWAVISLPFRNLFSCTCLLSSLSLPALCVYIMRIFYTVQYAIVTAGKKDCSMC